MGRKSKKSSPKASKSKISAGGGLKAVASAGVSALTGGSSKSSGGSGRRRKHGVSYWANKVMVAKLKKKYFRIQYGGMR